MRKVLTQGFSSFLRHRRVLRHFGRRPMLDVLTGQAHARTRQPPKPAAAAQTAVSIPQPALAAAAPGASTTALLQAATEEPAATLARLQSSAEGLDAALATQRRLRDGPNEIAHEKPLPGWLHLWHCYLNPFNLLLTALAALSWLSGDARATLVIGLMVGLSTLIRFVQEGRSHRAAEGLRTLVGNRATVLRPAAGAPAQRLEIPVRDLVQGDLVALSAGDMIPADCRLLSARDLFIAQAAITGESVPVEKFVERRGAATGPLEQSNLVFMGTNVVSGSAIALVLATGSRSYFGTLASRVAAVDPAPNAFQAGVNSVSWLLVRFALVMAPLVLLVNGFTKGDWVQAFLFALSVAVGLTPEMLPMIVTSTLAKGAVLLSRKKVIVKRLDAIQNFGAMDVLCTDKTGTLTQDKIAVARKDDVFGQPSDEVLNLAYLNSYYQTGLKNLLDHAVLENAELHAALKLGQDYRKIDEMPFDFQRRRMSVVVSQRDEQHQLICKGALEEVLAVCTQVRIGSPQEPQVAPLDAAMLQKVMTVAARLAEEGLRVVAVAMKTLPASQSIYAVADESGLTLVGTIAFLDPPKESAGPALKALAAHGVAVKVLTGDNAQVTAHVCAQVGLPTSAVLLGADVEGMDEAALRLAVEKHQIFAKLTPLHKERIVLALRSNAHVVGFMGDGINDAPALRAADIGISVDTAVDIAKEAADIILLEKSLLVLDTGVLEGRTTFCNMLKYIRMTASSNFGNVFSVLLASAFLPFLPMLPLQLLLQNLLYDISQTGIPFDNVDAEQVAKPLKWNPGDIGRFMLCFGPISSLFDISTFAVMWWIFDANSPARQGLFQSGWFVVGLLTQTLVVHMIRSARLPFLQSRAAAPLLASTLAIMLLGIWLPQGPLAAYFKFEPLPGDFFAWLAATLVAYTLAATAMKRFYVRRFGWQ